MPLPLKLAAASLVFIRHNETHTAFFFFFFMKAIGLILSYNILPSQRGEWLFYSLSQLVKDDKLTFTVWVQTSAWCLVAFVRQLIHMKAASWITVSGFLFFFFQNQEKRGEKHYIEKWNLSWFLSMCCWCFRSLWTLHATSMGRMTLRPTATQSTSQTSCQWGRCGPPGKRRTPNGEIYVLYLNESAISLEKQFLFAPTQ